MRLSRGSRRLLWATLFGAAACAQNVGRGGEAPIPTRMVVQPADFLGEVPCLRGPGAMRGYQVTLLDVTEDLPGRPPGPFALPTSSIVPCEVPVGFQFVVPGHRYVAQVSAFDLEPEELSQPSPGFPAVVDSTGRVVAPRWTTTCHGTAEALRAHLRAVAGGQGDAMGQGGAGGQSGAEDDPPRGARAVTNAQVPVRGCEPLTDAGESPTGMLVNLGEARVGLSCGTGPGQIASFFVQHPSLPAGAFGGECGDTVAVAPLPAGVDVTVDVTAVEAPQGEPGIGAGGAEGEPVAPPASWVTKCRARTALGALVPANCEPLVPFASP